jgi:nicotinate-nucleotide--dimethylbenzimidazole phosphoribosyltransferase
MKIQDIIESIQPLDKVAMNAARSYNDNLIKPLGSLGRLEDLAVQLAGITGRVQNNMEKKAILVFCADNGVYAEGVSTAPQEVTAVQATNMLYGKTGVSVLARQGNIHLKVVDVGIHTRKKLHPEMIEEKIALQTANILHEPAMTQQQLEDAIGVGFRMVKSMKEEGYSILGTGEMGISNTTTATSVIIALTGISPKEAAGKGAGLTRELLLHKIDVLEKIQEKHYHSSISALEVVRRMGGFDIAAMMGAFIGGAYYHVPIVIDGVVSIAAALACFCCNPLIKDYMLPSHRSAEPAYTIAAQTMKINPYFDLDMRLGEGSGCPFAMYLAESAAKIMAEMATFEEGNVDKKNYIDIREEEK